MADNVPITAGAGTNIATDDIAGVHFQRVKLVDGTLDSTGAIGGDAANGLDVDVTRLPALVAGGANIGDVDIASITAGETHIGLVSGGGKNVTATLTVTNGAYSIADVVGGLITFANATRVNGGHSIINSVELSGVVAIPYELWFFNADIATPAADNAVFALAAADGLKFLGAIPITAGDYMVAQTAFNNATVRACGLQVKSGAAITSIYAYLKATAVTSPGTTTIYMTVDFEYID